MDATIVVLGPTGTGKSSFIKLVTGNTNVVIGHSLESETDIIARYDFFHSSGRKVTLIDTPGFDDSRDELSDTDILRMLGDFLHKEFADGRSLSGVVYMHDISHNRFGGMNRRNLRMLQDLVGIQCLKNVLIVTTMWDTIDLADGEKHERELKTKTMFFKTLLDFGAQIFRHNAGLNSANLIISTILQNNPKPLLLQEELMDGRQLDSTTVGAGLATDLIKFNKRDLKLIRLNEQDIDAAQKDGDNNHIQELVLRNRRLKALVMDRLIDQNRLLVNAEELRFPSDESRGYRLLVILGFIATGASIGAKLLGPVGAMVGGVVAGFLSFFGM